MTPRQAELMAFIRTHIEANGVAPTYRAMAAAIGVSGVGHTHTQVKELIAQGHLVAEQDGLNRWRNIRLPGASRVDLRAVPTERLLAEIDRRKREMVGRLDAIVATSGLAA